MIFTSSTPPLQHLPNVSHQSIPAKNTVKRIAIFRALQLGDMLQAIPAIRAIRSGFPNAEITLIGLPWAEFLIQRFPAYLDRFAAFAGFPGITEVAVDPERTARFIEDQRAYGYDLAIQMHGSGRISNGFVLALEAGMTVGYYEDQPPAQLTLGAPYPDDQPEALRNLGLAKLLGCPVAAPSLEFPLFEQDYREAAELLHRLPSTGGPRIGLHTGARVPARRWPEAYFASLADELARRYNAQILLTGAANESETISKVIACMRTQPVNLVGKTSLGGLAALIRLLDLFISNDTGPAHLAYALVTPSITIFGPADDRRWAPLQQSHHLIVRHPVACSPCAYWECPFIDHPCLSHITSAQVMTVADKLLNNI